MGDQADALAYAFAKTRKQLVRVPCEGVGDNNGFWEMTPTPQPTPRGTDMANLSERLRATADLIRAWDKYELSGPVPDKLDYALAANQMSEAATILDRLTVEGLAGALLAAEGWSKADIKALIATNGSTWNVRRGRARALLTYINTPSVEETHD